MSDVWPRRRLRDVLLRRWPTDCGCWVRNGGKRCPHGRARVLVG